VRVPGLDVQRMPGRQDGLVFARMALLRTDVADPAVAVPPAGLGLDAVHTSATLGHWREGRALCGLNACWQLRVCLHHRVALPLNTRPQQQSQFA